MSRTRNSAFDAMTLLPWPVGMLTGLGVVFAAKVVVPALLRDAHNPFFSAIGKQLGAGALDPLVWMVAALCWVASAMSAYGRAKRRRLLDSQSDLTTLRSMSWMELEQLVSEAYRRIGYQVDDTGGGGADGGVDLVLRRQGVVTLVQCKQWKTQRVGVATVREQFGLLSHHQAAAAVIVTTGDFTPEARAFAKGKPIDLVAGPELLSLVHDVKRGGQPEQPRPSPPSPASALLCPKCDAPMVERVARKTGGAFLGCSKFPACRGSRPL
jgi:restriction system protein